MGGILFNSVLNLTESLEIIYKYALVLKNELILWNV